MMILDLVLFLLVFVVCSMATKITTQEQREQYLNDGYVVLSGLLSEEEVLGLRAGAERMHQHSEGPKGNPYFDVVAKNIVIDGPAMTMSDEDKEFVTESCRSVALYSKVPRVAAELMGASDNVRLLRDVFLGKGVKSPKACGWHVDDPSFWPESFQSTGGHGVNAWIALVDLPRGGGLGVSAGSHRAPWRHEAYEALGQDHSVTGYSKEEIFETLKKTRLSSCSLDEIDPRLFDTIEQGGVYPEMKQGDIIFHTRLLFHKTTALSQESVAYYEDQGLRTLDRYSLRYVSGKATLPTGFVNELSVLSDASNAGRTLDEVAQEDAPWYPQVWPTPEPDFALRMEELSRTKVPEAKAAAKAITAELIQLMLQQQQQQQDN